MATSNNDRISSSRLLTFATDLWAKIKTTFYAKGSTISVDDIPSITKSKISDFSHTHAISEVTDLNTIIPSTASATNQLADKAYADAIGERLEARYISADANGNPFATHADLVAATTYYYHGEVATPDTNDITTITNDETHLSDPDDASTGMTTRYRYNGTDADGKVQWSFEYVINNTGLSLKQLQAVNSGINETLVTKLTNVEENANNYAHPSYDESTATASKIGRDSSGHVIIGNAITASDIGAAEDTHYHKSFYTNTTTTSRDISIGETFSLPSKTYLHLSSWTDGTTSSYNEGITVILTRNGTSTILLISWQDSGTSMGNFKCMRVRPNDTNADWKVKYMKTASSGDLDIYIYPNDVATASHNTTYHIISNTKKTFYVNTETSINTNVLTDATMLNISKSDEAGKVSNALTFGSKTYDGSAAAEITASDLGAITDVSGKDNIAPSYRFDHVRSDGRYVCLAKIKAAGAGFSGLFTFHAGLTSSYAASGMVFVMVRVNSGGTSVYAHGISGTMTKNIPFLLYKDGSTTSNSIYIIADLYNCVASDSESLSSYVSWQKYAFYGNGGEIFPGNKWTSLDSLTEVGWSPNKLYYGNADTATNAYYLYFRHENEINYKNISSTGGYHKNVWFNYRNGDTDSLDTSRPVTGYYFGNRNGVTSGVTLYASNFSGNAATATTCQSASQVKGHYTELSRDVVIRGDTTTGDTVIAAPGTTGETTATGHAIIFRPYGSNVDISSTQITENGYSGNAATATKANKLIYHQLEGTSGTGGWIEVIRHTVTNTYANSPFVATIYSRAKSICRVEWRWAGGNSTETSISSIFAHTYSSTALAGVAYTTTTVNSQSVLKLWVKKAELYDAIGVCVDYNEHYRPGKFEYPNTVSSDKPSGATDVTINVIGDSANYLNDGAHQEYLKWSSPDITKVSPSGGTSRDHSKYLAAWELTSNDGSPNVNAVVASAVTVGEADKIDGYHLSVTTSIGTDASTIYFVM